jgi:transposase
MLHVGLDLRRTRVDVHGMDAMGTPVLVTSAAPDTGGLASLVSRVGEFGQPVTAAIESMTGARFVHDQLELRGRQVAIADAVTVKGLAPLTPAKTDKIDARVLAELSRRDLVPAIWLPDPALRTAGADHPYVPLLITVPGIGWVLGYTIAAEIGDIARFDSPKKPVGYIGLCPTVYQSGRRDHRDSLAKNGPKYLRWEFI